MMATTVNDDGLKRGLMASGTLHLLLFLFLYFGLPVFFNPPPTDQHVPVPLQIVEIDQMTNTRVKEPEEKPEVKPPEPPPPKPEAAKPEPAQSLPQPKPPEPEPEALNAMPKPMVKPTPPAPVKPKTDDLASLMKNLEAHKKTFETKSEAKPDPKSQTTQQPNSQAPALSNRLTISESDAVRRQIELCWSPPIGARDAQKMVVQVTGDITPEGVVQNAEVVDKSRSTTDSFYRAMAESAIRALYNPKCSPLKLPADKYEEWKHFVFTFDPSDML